MPENAMSGLNSARTIVVPRDSDAGKLKFYVLFNFDIRDESAAGDSDLLRNWPAYVEDVAKGMKARITISGGVTLENLPVELFSVFPEASQIQRKYTTGLGFAQKDKQAASQAWKTIFSTAPSARRVASVQNGSAQHSGLKLMAMAGRLDEVMTNPAVATDLRPIHRFEQPDRAALQQAFQSTSELARSRRALDRDDLSRIQTGALEADRVRRLIESSRNTNGGGSDNLANREVRREAEAFDLTFNKLFGRVSQFPGLMRRLKLALFCSIDAPPSVMNQAALLNGTIAIQTFSFATGPQSFEFLGLPTEFELSTANKWFRPKSHEIEDQPWKSSYLIKAASYEVSQHDYTAWAAGLVSSADKKEARVSHPTRTEFIGIYRKSTIAGKKEADAIRERLAHAARRSMRLDQIATAAARMRSIELELKGVRLAEGERNARVATLNNEQQNDAAHRIAVLQDPMNASQLIRGVTVDVQADGKEWKSLCMREVTLKDRSGKVLLQWLEEGFVPTSATETPPPTVGEVESIAPDGVLKVKIFGTPLRKTNPLSVELRYAADIMREFQLAGPDEFEPTRILSIVGRLSTAGDIVANDIANNIIGDIVQVTAHVEDGQRRASTLYLYPVLKSQLGANDPSQGDGFFIVAGRRTFTSQIIHNFPVLIRKSAGSRFLDATGLRPIAPNGQPTELSTAEIAQGMNEGYTVEGIRRFVLPNGDLRPVQAPVSLQNEGLAVVIADSLPEAKLSTIHLNLDQGDQLKLIPLKQVNPALNNAIRLGAATKLELVRGSVQSVVLEFAGKIAADRSFPDFPLVFPNPPDASTAAQHRIVRGIAQYDGTRWIVQSWRQSALLDSANRATWTDEERALVARSEFEFRIILREQSGKTRDVYLSTANPTSDRPALAQFFSQKQVVECIVVRKGNRIVARAMPKPLFGTLSGTPAKPRLLMPDGTVQLTPPVPGNQAIPATGYFVIREDNNSIVQEGAEEPFRIAGEVVNVLASNGGILILVRVPGAKKTWSVRVPTNFQLMETADPSFQRRVRDLEIGDFVILDTNISGNGELTARTGSNTRNLVTIVGQLSSSDGPETTMLREGSNALVPIELTTEARYKRTIWAKSVTAGIGDTWLAPAMPVIDAKTVTLLKRVAGIAAPAQRRDPTPEERTNPGLVPVTVSLSDAIARWNGWSLVVPELGHADKVDEMRATGAVAEDRPFSIEVTIPSEVKLPKLRERSTYNFRMRRSDLAGNHGLDEPLDKLAFQDEQSWVNSLDGPYLRADDEPAAPIIAVSDPKGRLLVPLGDADENEKSKKPVVVARRLLYVSDPVHDPSGVAGKEVAPGTLWILPPACAIATIIKSGQLERFSSPEELFDQHERHFEHGTYVFDNGKLNYFPDPLVYAVSGGAKIEITVADQDGFVFRKLGTLERPIVVSPDFDLPGNKEWPNCAPVKVILKSANVPAVSLNGRSVLLRLPPSWSGWAQVRNNNQSNQIWTEFQIIHATSSPRLRPRWVSLIADMAKSQNESVDQLRGTLEIHPRSTGSIGLAAYWNQYWDETTPLHFVEPVLACEVWNGALHNVSVENVGNGFGTACRFVFEHSNGLRLGTSNIPVLEATLISGKLTAVKVVHGGSSLPDAIKLRALRRPPLTSFALGEVTLGKAGEISDVKILHPGGYYAQPPIVVFYDAKGDGWGAVASADLNENGEVVGVRFEIDETTRREKRGQMYSNETVVNFFTHSKLLPEIPIPPIGRPSLEEFRAEQRKTVHTEHFDFQFEHPFGDTISREMFYVASGITRSREILNENLVNGAPQPQTRNSAPHRVEVRSTARPPRPEWRRHSYAFKWSSNPSSAWPFRMNAGETELVIRREAAIRCYLRRGWNKTGRELLGVVVMNAQVNTIEFTGHPPGSIIPAGMRGLVSRWGYDPVWDDTAVPPLNLDDFTNQVGFVAYEDIVEYVANDERLVGIALHEVQYDPDKELYYADISLRAPRGNPPFVQLALVRYQQMAIDGAALSEVTLTDPIRLPGDRELKIERNMMSPNRYDVSLKGPFPTHAVDVGRLPRREVTVEVRRRLANHSPEIEGPLANSNETSSVDYENNLLDDRFSSPDIFTLKQDDAGIYRGPCSLQIPRTGSQAFYLRVVEREIYQTGEPQRDRTGDKSGRVGVMSATDWIPFTCAVHI